jgi:hypothetical protein
MNHMKILAEITAAFLILLNTSCKNDDDKPDEPNYGIEYFECKINGEPFQAVSIPFQCSGPVFDYYPEPFLSVPAKSMYLAGIHCPTYDAIGIGIFGYNEELGSINFNEATIVDSVLVYYSYDPDSLSSRILYENLIDGNINIEELIPRASGNSRLGTIKGTFEFTVTDETGMDTIHVTDGRFRFDVPQIF